LGKDQSKCSGITLITVEEALKLGGCPVCRAVRKSEEDLIKSILYEGVNDPSIRRSFRESLGLCPYHAWLFVEVVRKPDVLDGLGSTIIYEDMLSEAIELFKEGKYQKIINPEGCPLCKHSRQVESNIINDFIDCFKQSPETLIAYEESPSIFCFKHFISIYVSLEDYGIRQELLKIQERKLNELHNLLKEYIRKADYRVREPVTKEEADAWVSAVEVLKGYPTSLNMSYHSKGNGVKGSKLPRLFGGRET
jgi:hypothetical protein